MNDVNHWFRVVVVINGIESAAQQSYRTWNQAKKAFDRSERDHVGEANTEIQLWVREA